MLQIVQEESENIQPTPIYSKKKTKKKTERALQTGTGSKQVSPVKSIKELIKPEKHHQVL